MQNEGGKSVLSLEKYRLARWRKKSLQNRPIIRRGQGNKRKTSRRGSHRRGYQESQCGPCTKVPWKPHREEAALGDTEEWRAAVTDTPLIHPSALWATLVRAALRDEEATL